MRSCLIQLIVLLGLGFVLVWFVLPLGAGWLATTALNATGFTGTDTTVVVSANPPPVLLTGRADSIHLTSTKVGVRDLHAAAVDLTLSTVNLIGRTFETASGTLDMVAVATPDGSSTTVSRVTIDGSSVAARAVLTMTTAEAAKLIESQLKAQANVTGKVTFQAPDRMTVTINGKSQSGRMIAVNGALVVVPDGGALPTVTLIAPGEGNPFKVTTVKVTGAGVTLAGTIDLQSILF